MRNLLYAFCALLLLGASACGGVAVDNAAVVANVAKAYYDSLLAGKYERFVDGMDMPSEIPADYRSQLVVNARMFMAQMREEHKGIDSIHVRRAALDSAACSASVFLMFHYGDSTVEQVMVPMVRRGTVWYMR